MKRFFPALIILSAILFACGSGNEKTDEQKKDGSVKESVIKTTRQFITNEDGTVTENQTEAEIIVYSDKISFVFASKPDQNFEFAITAKEESPSGVKYIVKDKKYTDVFISGGAEPQVNLNASYGSTTFM